VGKTTRHHQQGDIFRAELQMHLPGASLRAETEKDNLYAAIDEAHDELGREIKKWKNKQTAKQRHGARILKKLLSVFYR
jgi:ribosomal subunit interface protein